MVPATAKCAAGTLRRASRSITRVYDDRLAPAGLTTMQFSILRTLDRRDHPTPLSELADELAFERTSLYRALKPLARDGLVVVTTDRGRVKRVGLTANGRRRVQQALPHWTAAQETFLDRFGRSAWNTLSAQLVAIVEIARGMPDADE
jgi:DNA-binding MarR family transcriptional regulator